MKILFDARPLSRPNSGIGRYLRQLLPELLELESTWEFIGIIDADHSDFPRFQNLSFITIKAGGLAAVLFPFLSSLLVHKIRPDWYWGTRHHLPLYLPKAVCSIVTVHDVIWKEFPETMPNKNLFNERWLFPKSVKKADVVAVTTNVCKRKVIYYFGLNPQKVHTVAFPILSSIAQTTTSPISERFVLSVGTFEPRKNFEFIIENARKIVKAAQVDSIVIAGSNGWGGVNPLKYAESLGVANLIKVVVSPDDQQLANLYASAKLLLSASRAEGFGLSIAEALSFGTPVVSSNIDEVREIFGNSVHYFELDNIVKLVAKLEQYCFDGIPPIQGEGKKNWSNVASEMIDIITDKKGQC